MKAEINENFQTLFFYEDERQDGYIEVDDECVSEFNKGDEVEILKVIEIGDFAERQKAYVIFNPKTKESITAAECFLRNIKEEK